MDLAARRFGSARSRAAVVRSTRGLPRTGCRLSARGSPLLAAGTEGINGVELSNAMLLSTWTDDWVHIPVDEDLYYEELQKRVATSKVKEEGGQVMNVQGTF